VVRERVAPEKFIARAYAEERVDATQRARRLRQLVAVVSEEGPVEVALELRRVERRGLPRGGCAEDDSVPRGLEKRLAVVVPFGVHHAEHARLLPVAYEVDDIRRG